MNHVDLVLVALVAVSPLLGDGDARAEPVIHQCDDLWQTGVEIGGPNYVEMMFRRRLAHGVYAELGLEPFVPPILMGSAGLVATLPLTQRVSIFTAGGISGIAMLATDACPADAVDCVDADAAWFGNARVGVSVAYGRNRRIAVDVGFWRGEAGAWGNHGLAGRREFTVPVIGIAWLVGDDDDKP